MPDKPKLLASPEAQREEWVALLRGHSAKTPEGLRLQPEAVVALADLLEALNTRATPVLPEEPSEYDRDEIARILFEQRQTGHNWDESAEADPDRDAGTLRSICFDDADAVITALPRRRPLPDEEAVERVCGILSSERYVFEWVKHGRVNASKLPEWEQPYQDAGAIEEAQRKGYLWIGRNVGCDITLTPAGEAIAAMIARLASIPSTEGGLRKAAKDLIASRTDHYTARNNRRVSIEGDDGEKCWIVPFDAMNDLEITLTASPSNGVPEPNCFNCGRPKAEHGRSRFTRPCPDQFNNGDEDMVYDPGETTTLPPSHVPVPVEVLEFYAREWKSPDHEMEPSPALLQDCGQRARQALAAAPGLSYPLKGD